MNVGAAEWVHVETDTGVVENLAQQLGIPVAIAAILTVRGFTEMVDAELFLHPRLSNLSDPFALPGMAHAVQRIWHAIDETEKIVVYGDYDADGVTSAALLSMVLRQLGARVSVFLPNRLKHGYGLSAETVECCRNEHDPSLIVTADCGTSAVEAVELARSYGIDIIVTDHHEAGEQVSEPLALINPKLSDNSCTSLAGVGVAFKLCHGVIKQAMADDRPEAHSIDLRNWLDLVAVGTVADIVPLSGENRILVRYGLKCLAATENKGLMALKDRAGLNGTINTHHLGFVICPRINAAGRLGNADTALNLLMAEDTETAVALAADLEKANTERKRIEASIRQQAIRDVEARFNPEEDFGLVVAGDGWHHGAIGIVASRICDAYSLPTVVIGFDDQGVGRGSCRSVESVNMLEILQDCGGHLETFGGHKMAAGLTILRESLPAFERAFNALCADRLRGHEFRATHTVDAWLSCLGEADYGLLDWIEMLRPFGAANPAPTWGIRGVSIVGQPRTVGKDSKHLKLVLASGATQMDAIAFGMGDRSPGTGDLDILFNLEENVYMGRRSLQLNIIDLRPHEDSTSA